MLRALVIALATCAPAVAQDFFTLKGHGGPIMDVAVAPNGTIGTASFDNAVGVWQGTTPKWLDGHRAAANALAFYSNSLVVSGGDDFAVRLWSIDGGGVELGAHQNKVTDLAVCRQGGNLIASSSWDGLVRLWDMGPSASDVLVGVAQVASVDLHGHTNGVNDVVFSDDCKTLYSAASDGTIRVWDVKSGQERQVLAKHGFGVNELILNDAEGWLAYGAVDGGTRIIDSASGAVLADFTLGRRPILAMAFDPVGAQLAVGDGEGFIMMIDTETRRISRDFKAAQRGPIWALAFSRDGQNIHAGGIEDILYSWPVETLGAHAQMSTATRSFHEDPKTLPNGERQFKRKCSVCHTLTEGSARKAGPSLYKLFGKRAGTVPDYAYSDTLTGSKIVWSAETINALFDLGPDHYIPGSKMPMQRIVKRQDRDDLIDYLRRNTAEKGE